VNRAGIWMEKLMASGFEVNEASFLMMTQAFSRAGDTAKADAWLSRMNEYGFMGNISCWNQVLKACAQSLEPYRAAELFAKMIEAGKKPNTISYSHLIDAWAWAGEGRRAVETFMNMKDAGFKASRETYITVARALESSGDADLVDDLLIEMKQDGIPQSEQFLSAQLRVYAAADPPLVEKAVSAFSEAMESGVYPTESVRESLAWVVGEENAQDMMPGVQGGSRASESSDDDTRKRKPNPWIYEPSALNHPPGLPPPPGLEKVAIPYATACQS